MITLKGQYLGDLIEVTSIGGRGPMTQEAVLQQKNGSPGSHYKKRIIPERFIPVTFELVGDSLEDIRKKVDSLNDILNLAQPEAITFSDEPGLTYYGLLSGQPDWDEYLSIGKGRITFVCPDPYKYGEEKTMSLGPEPFLNEGSVEVSPIVSATFTAAASEYKITHSDGKFVRVIYNFVAGDQLAIDVAKRKVLINGVVNQTTYYWGNKPFKLLPGENTLTVTPVGTETTITYRPARS
jgi:predicted phage tail component-like protein